MSQVLIGALGRYTVDALRQSALAAFPTLGTIRGASAPAQDRLGLSTWVKRLFKKKVGHRAHEVGQDHPPEQEGVIDDEASGEEEEEDGQADGDEDEGFRKS